MKKAPVADRSKLRSKAAADLRAVSRELRKFALSFPRAEEEFPWGERVAKVNGKVFVFLGCDPVPGGPIGLSVKLPESGSEALDLPFAEPTGYGLGKSGWVTARFEPGKRPPVEILKAWIRESYSTIGPSAGGGRSATGGRESSRRKPRGRTR